MKLILTLKSPATVVFVFTVPLELTLWMSVVLARSSSGSPMFSEPKTLPPSEPVAVIPLFPSALSFDAAVMVTCTEGDNAGSVTWWPVALLSVSAGITLYRVP